MDKVVENQTLTISVIIPTMNRFNSLSNTITHFLQDSKLIKEIIIIDQSNDGKTSKLIKDYICNLISTPCEIKYLFQNEPSSTDARNYGMSVATGDLLVFSDDDVEILSNTMTNIISLMEDEKISLIAGANALEPKHKSPLQYVLGFRSIFRRNTGHIAPGIFGVFPDKLRESNKTTWAMGFFFVVRRSLVEKWNMKWDERLRSYAFSEDLDFSHLYYKLSKNEGYKCIVSSNVVVKHLHSYEYRIPSRKYTFMYVLNRAYLYKKHHFSYYYWIMFKITNFAVLIRKIIRKENPKDMKDAMKYLRNHKKEVFNGNFNYGEQVNS